MEVVDPRVTEAAQFLHDLRRRRTPPATSIPATCAPRSLTEAYEIQRAFVALRLAQSGGHQIGYKVACTNPSAQAAVMVDQPLFGCLLSHSTYQSPVTLEASPYRVRCIEAEFAFSIAADVPARQDGYTRDSICAYVEAVLPGIEIVDHYFEDWARLGAFGLIADNAIHGAWVRGRAGSAALARTLIDQSVVLSSDGTVVQTGSGRAVLGDPLLVLAWLANELPKFGHQLRAGDYVTTGITTGVYFATAGERLSADFGPLGRVDLEFA